ncbi:hypothetical protein GCM10028805_55430 [Spirosoma harenae]
MKKILAFLLGLTVTTASFANPMNPAGSETRVVMTNNHKIKLYIQPIATKGELSIRDAKGQTLYQSIVALKKGLSQQFDLSNLGTGTYQMTLKTGGQVVTKTFVVQADPDTSFIMQES